jgi:hypothetical protein
VHLLVLLRRQAGRILIQSLPALAALSLRVNNPQRAIAFQSTGDEKAPVTGA